MGGEGWEGGTVKTEKVEKPWTVKIANEIAYGRQEIEAT